MKRLLLLALATAISFLANAQSGRLAELYPENALDSLLAAPGQFKSVPTAADGFWRATLPQAVRQSYIDNAHGLKNLDWSQIPDRVFAECMANGNRTHYEAINFGRRRNLAKLVMGEVMEHEGKLIPEILKGLEYLKKEPWWGVAAHYSPDSVRRYDRQVVDLFNAETGNLVAWTVYMLGDELEAARPGIVDEMKAEVQHRLLVPTIEAKKSMCGWMFSKSNWNAWICENLLSCATLCAANRGQQTAVFAKVLASIDGFANKYSPDGGCEEGIGYWDRAGGSYFECCNLLSLASDGRIDLRRDSFLLKLGKYPYCMHIAGPYYVNYADAPARPGVNFNMAYPFGHFDGDNTLAQLGAYIAQSKHFADSASVAYNHSGNWPVVSRELTFLALYDKFKGEKPQAPLFGDSWFPSLQVMTARAKAGSTQGLFVSAKAGNNNELHNHNDVGNFIVFCNGKPVMIDIGQATYDAFTFSKLRYTRENTRSAYHNVPLINGCEQQEGKQHTAASVSYSRKGNTVTFSQDIAATYDKEAGVKSWVRTLVFNRKSLRVSETYSLSKCTQAPELHFMLAQKPNVGTPGRVVLNSGSGRCSLVYDAAQMTATCEALKTEGPGFNKSWGDVIYRLILKAKTNRLNGKIEYTIK